MMKRKTSEAFAERANRLVANLCIVTILALGPVTPSALAADPAPTPGPPVRPLPAPPLGEAPTVKVNRTVPKVEPFSGKLAFSPSPTEAELFTARIFAEPLVPVGGRPAPAENRALAAALVQYSQRSSSDDFSALTGFLAAHPNSAWTASVQLNLGLEYDHNGYRTRALEAYQAAWNLSNKATEARGKAVGDRSLGELAAMEARMHRLDDLNPLLSATKNRSVSGPATEKLSLARGAQLAAKQSPEGLAYCGPVALYRILRAVDPAHAGAAADIVLKGGPEHAASTLTGLAQLSKKVGLDYQMAFRESGTPLVTPSVIHLKSGHYAAIVRQEGPRYLVLDPAYRNDMWFTVAALTEEASGYFLVPRQIDAQGWRNVSDAEGAKVIGTGPVPTPPPPPPTPPNPGGPPFPCTPGMSWANSDGSSGDCPGNSAPPSPCPPGMSWVNSDGSSGDCPAGPAPTGPAPAGPAPFPIEFPSDPYPGPPDDPIEIPADCDNANCILVPFGSTPPVYFGATNAGMAVPSIELSSIDLFLQDRPVGYKPPVGPQVYFALTYNYLDASQPTTFTYSNLGPKWTFSWQGFIIDDPLNSSASVTYYVPGGGQQTFSGFNPATASFASGLYNQALLTRTSATSYQLLFHDGSVQIFSQSDGSTGSARRVFLTQVIDRFGNTVNLTYDSNLRLVAITDAIGQVTTLSYGNASDIYKITQVTDPFGRFATFGYTSGTLTSITDVIGITSQFTYGSSDFISQLTTPYGNTTFTMVDNGVFRSLLFLYPDGNREYAEYNDTENLPVGGSDSAASVPTGIATTNLYLNNRNTFYWSKIACGTGYGDYTQAKEYHWLHDTTLSSSCAVLESVKQPLENRVWYDYQGQGGTYGSIVVGSTNQPWHTGRVLDDGTTQLTSYQYDNFGNRTQIIDPLGRTFSNTYAANGIDLLQTAMTRGGANQILAQATYNAQHLPLTITDAAGQTTNYTYNAQGQLLTQTDAKSETISLAYNANSYRTSLVGPLSGPGDLTSWTYDSYGRVQSATDVSGYTLTFGYDALNRLTTITFPDSTFKQFTYTNLDRTLMVDRAGRQTKFTYNAVRQVLTRTDPLNRVTLYQWCKCGDLKSLTDPMGRTTIWHHDVQGRVSSKQYADGSTVSYAFENTTSRIHQRVDEKFQVTNYAYNLDDTLAGMSYDNTAVSTSAVTFTYDPNYLRIASMSDGAGTTAYSYVPITVPPALGAGRLASEVVSFPQHTLSYGYDQLGRRTSTAIDGVASSLTLDAANRVTNVSNALGAFTYTYDGNSQRKKTLSYPNGQSAQWSYGVNTQDFDLQQITNLSGVNPVSQFVYGTDVPTHRITSWSQQSGAQTPSVSTLSYDAADQLSSVSVAQGAVTTGSYGYSYDTASNRLTAQIGSVSTTSIYNALNELTSDNSAAAGTISYQWDGEKRLSAVNVGNQSTQFSYDGRGRCIGILELVNGSEVSNRLFVWCGNELSEERTSTNAVTKRYFPQGMQLATGATAGLYYYTRDHLGSIREMCDATGTIRAAYAYDPFGQQTQVSGDLVADFGFAGMFWSPEASLNLTVFRAYNSVTGRWLSRDSLPGSEIQEGPNLFGYVQNNPVNLTERRGLWTSLWPSSRAVSPVVTNEK